MKKTINKRPKLPHEKKDDDELKMLREWYERKNKPKQYRTAKEIIESCCEDGYYLRTGLADTIERMSSEEMQAFCKEVVAALEHKELSANDMPDIEAHVNWPIDIEK